ncbi:NAD(P)H-hydrate dehydratase [Candidatus Woesearchaeota archaeon]|nr:NAD(P)H-hydrate dehydratase [Candidatus Woesearchaeota archaeon]
MKKRKLTSHKGENGIVLVIGGSELYVGAPILASMSALSSGVDLAFVAAPELVSMIANVYSPDIISVKLPGKFLKPGHFNEIKKYVKKADCLVIGNGAGLRKETLKLLRKAAKIDKPKVLDADALDAIKGLDIKNCVLTPHHGEFRDLYGEDGNIKTIKKHARKDRIILLKGHVDLISDGNTVVKVKGGNPAMAVGGTGDVLAGLVAGLIAQGEPLMKAAVKASRINKKAGDIIYRKKGYGLLASDLLEIIPKIIKN